MSIRVGVLVVSALVSSMAIAETPLVLHWNPATQSSIATVVDSNGTALATVTWNAPLPSAYAANPPQEDVPAPLVGLLRDQLDASNALEAPTAAAFIRSLMDADANTPVVEIPSTRTVWLRFDTLRIVEACGSSFDATGCHDTCTGSSGSFACNGCACKRTTILPR